MTRTIKIVHTADFHLGVPFSGLRGPRIHERRMEDFRRNVVRVFDEAIRWDADIVLIAGDVFHRVNPSSRELVFIAEQLSRLIREKIHVVIIAGNHDKPKVSGAHSPLEALDRLKIPYLKYVRMISGPIIINVDDVRIGIVAIPYVNPVVVARGSNKNYAGYIKTKIRESLEGLEIVDVDYRILLAHVFVSGATVSGHYISPSSGEAIELDVLMPYKFDYVALGHIHTLQQLRNNVYYSGSIERIDFSEANEEKGFLLVELQDGELHVQKKRLDCRKMMVKKVLVQSMGFLETLEKELGEDVQDSLLKLIVRGPNNLLNELGRLQGKLEEILIDKLKVFGYTIARESIEGIAYEQSKQIERLKVSIREILKEYIHAKIRDKELAEKLYELALAVFEEVGML